VRPDANSISAPRWGAEVVLACRVELAGASPALVITGEPGSRLPSSGEIPPVKRSVESPSATVWSPGGEQSYGPSVRRTLQPRDRCPRKGGVGRAGHVAAKATDCTRRSGGMQDAPGVRRRARSDSSTRNWRDPHRLPTSGEGAAYKRNVKWQRAGRESEGFVVPSIAGESWTEGRDPTLAASEIAEGCRSMAFGPKSSSRKAPLRSRRLFAVAKYHAGQQDVGPSNQACEGDDPLATKRLYSLNEIASQLAGRRSLRRVAVGGTYAQ
jgi:hypothetical protein